MFFVFLQFDMEQTILIADAGSTKTDWQIVGGPVVRTDGISAVHQSWEAIEGIVRGQLLPQLGGRTIDKVRFYGSGQRPEHIPQMRRLLAEALGCKDVEVASDMLGAAIALCGHSEGIAAILGTGANSCLYDGQKIVANTPALGYIVGDEGSGASLGRLLINGLYKGWLPAALRGEFERWADIDLPRIIDRIYRQPLANRWLASLSPFIAEHIAEPAVEQMVVEAFRQFLRLNIAPYNRPDLAVNAVGSIAWHYRSQLAKAAALEGFRTGKIARSPLGQGI